MTAHLTHILTVFTFAAHVFAGCCSHHAHAQNVVPASHGSSSQWAAGTACGHDHHSGSSEALSDADGGPCHHDPYCGESACSYVGAAKPALPVAEAAQIWTVALLQDLADCLHSQVRFSFDAVGEWIAHSAPQRCAVLNTWQI